MEKIVQFSFQKDKFKLNLKEIKHPSTGVILVSGISGAGKTSFLRSMAGLEDEASSYKWSVDNSKRGFHFQDIKVFPNLSLKENLTIVSENHKKAELFLSKVKLGDKKDDLTSSLSGGERQRLGFLRAFMTEAKLVFLDEPFGQVDSELRNLMYKFIDEYREDHLIFISTHISGELKFDYEIKIS